MRVGNMYEIGNKDGGGIQTYENPASQILHYSKFRLFKTSICYLSG